MSIVRRPLPDWVVDLPSRNTITGKRLYNIGDDVWYPSVTSVLGGTESSRSDSTSQSNPWERKRVGPDHEARRAKTAAENRDSVLEFVAGWLATEVSPALDEVDRAVRAPTLQLIRECRTNLSEIWLAGELVYSHQLQTVDLVEVIGVWDGQPSVIVTDSSPNRKTPDQIERLFLRGTAQSLCWLEQTGELVEGLVAVVGNETLFKPQVFTGTIYDHIDQIRRRFDGSLTKRPNVN